MLSYQVVQSIYVIARLLAVIIRILSDQIVEETLGCRDIPSLTPIKRKAYGGRRTQIAYSLAMLRTVPGRQPFGDGATKILKFSYGKFEGANMQDHCTSSEELLNNPFSSPVSKATQFRKSFKSVRGARPTSGTS
jgi:hypothetical protein